MQMAGRRSTSLEFHRPIPGIWHVPLTGWPQKALARTYAVLAALYLFRPQGVCVVGTAHTLDTTYANQSPEFNPDDFYLLEAHRP